MFIHSTVTLPILGSENKKSKDIEVGDQTLISLDTEYNKLSFEPILDIQKENYKDWYKIIFNNDLEFVIDRNSEILLEDNTFKKLQEINTTHRLYNLSGDNLYIKTKKDFNRESLSYRIKTSQEYIFLDQFIFKNN